MIEKLYNFNLNIYLKIYSNRANSFSYLSYFREAGLSQIQLPTMHYQITSFREAVAVS